MQDEGSTNDQVLLDRATSRKDRPKKTRQAKRGTSPKTKADQGAGQSPTAPDVAPGEESDQTQRLLEESQEVLDREQADLDRDQAALKGDLTHLDKAELHREQAAIDRAQSALDREQAKLDRAQATLDRVSGIRKDYLIDELTGILRRGPGLTELQHEIDRARRGKHPLVVAFIDVNGLKAVNDRNGHAAGDQVLREVAEALRHGLRSYDLLFRYGGDEFVCALSEADVEHVEQRLRNVAAALGEAPSHASIDWGLAELKATDNLDDLVERADSALYMVRRSRDELASE